MNHAELDRWDEFVGWARRFYEFEDFDEQERIYKLEVASTLQEVRDALGHGEPWLPHLRKAFGPPNNITSWRTHDAFLKWADSSRRVQRGNSRLSGLQRALLQQESAPFSIMYPSIRSPVRAPG